jgi:hypothetical protein
MPSKTATGDAALSEPVVEQGGLADVLPPVQDEPGRLARLVEIVERIQFCFPINFSFR